MECSGLATPRTLFRFYLQGKQQDGRRSDEIKEADHFILGGMQKEKEKGRERAGKSESACCEKESVSSKEKERRGRERNGAFFSLSISALLLLPPTHSHFVASPLTFSHAAFISLSLCVSLSCEGAGGIRHGERSQMPRTARRTTGGMVPPRQRQRMAIDLSLFVFFFAAFVAATADPTLAAATAIVTGAIIWPGEIVD